MGRHIQFADRSLADFRKEADLNIEALNHATANIDPAMMRLHVCWGNYEGPHHCDVPIKDIIDLVFQARPNSIAFEAANPRHAHEWTAWRDAAIPDDKILAPGVISSTSNYIEHPELIAQRIQTFAAIVGPDRVVAGTDCGFGTWSGFGPIDPSICWAKLEALSEGAALASSRLF
jgi:5-methyltetrahydropteroyltriglutamate--homocysteine methyltransferase